MDSLLFYVIGIVGIIIVGKILLFPMKLILKFVSNAVIGGILLFIANIFGSYVGLYIAITPIRALVVGILGIPGIILVALL